MPPTSSENTASPTNPVTSSSAPSKKVPFAEQPLDALLALSLNDMSMEEKRAYVDALRAARSNAQTLHKQVRIGQTKSKKAKKPGTGVSMKKLTDLYDIE